MTATLIKTPEERPIAVSDERLVRECLKGNDESWSALIDKYKNLIFSIPIKYGLSRDEAADIFQGVCLELLSELPTLRDPRALPKWLMQVTAHKCFHWKHRQQRLVSSESDESAVPEGQTPALAEQVIHEAEQEQIIREALAKLAPRCRRLVHMLFYEEPLRPYRDIAAELGLAVGSIGFIRQRCLDRLRRNLNELGFSESDD
jgi:RNA polymerase sigma factor (sigma-70 family)